MTAFAFPRMWGEKQKIRAGDDPAQTDAAAIGEGGAAARFRRDKPFGNGVLYLVAVFLAAAFTLLVNSVVAALTCFLMLSLASSKLPLAIWPSASLVLTVMPNSSWPLA